MGSEGRVEIQQAWSKEVAALDAAVDLIFSESRAGKDEVFDALRRAHGQVWVDANRELLDDAWDYAAWLFAS
jgi:hypothetical protein